MTAIIGIRELNVGREMTKRVTLQLSPAVFELLQRYKEAIHHHASPKSIIGDKVKQRRLPMTWNQFFTILVTDWENGRTKCHCSAFYDCPQCHNTRKYFQLKQDRQFKD